MIKDHGGDHYVVNPQQLEGEEYEVKEDLFNRLVRCSLIAISPSVV